MSAFKEHRVEVRQLLEYIPERLLSNLSSNTNIDYYAKVLHGKKLFYLLMYGILENDRLSQRTLEDTFNDPVFKFLFKLDPSEKVRRSSISERLSKVSPAYFKQIYECIYKQFSSTYSESQSMKYNLIRVDSSIISEASGKLEEGIRHSSGKKTVKYSIAFDGMLPCYSKVFTASTYSSEDIALPEVIKNHVKIEENHSNLYVIDRGVQSGKTMKDFQKDSIQFICRAKEKRKYVELESLLQSGQNVDFGESILIKDSKVNIYTGTHINNKRGRLHYKEELVDTTFRLIIIESKIETGKQYWFLTNVFDLTAEEIAQAYRRRWDIEVFFRFIKQELNVSHLVSLNKNGIEVMLYMTLIIAMLILIYKHANKISYKTAKRRFNLELRNMVISLIVIECGGQPDRFFGP
jgi:hypothetical protein